VAQAAAAVAQAKIGWKAIELPSCQEAERHEFIAPEDAAIQVRPVPACAYRIRAILRQRLPAGVSKRHR
jgi:hypothetical protein